MDTHIRAHQDVQGDEQGHHTEMLRHYIADMLVELTQMARQSGQEDLCQLLRLVARAAKNPEPEAKSTLQV